MTSVSSISPVVVPTTQPASPVRTPQPAPAPIKPEAENDGDADDGAKGVNIKA